MDPTRQPPPLVNVGVIDGQHAVLIENIERLEQALDAGEDAGLPQMIRGIAECARQHGPAEERLMAIHDYPLREVHAMEHEKFAARLRTIEKMVAEGHVTAAVGMLRRLRAWLESHVMEWDSKLGEFLNSRGVA